MFYTYKPNPDLLIVDFHADGHFLYPGRGHSHETGKGNAEGTKLNLPPPMNADKHCFGKDGSECAAPKKRRPSPTKSKALPVQPFT